jgi:hypothetical protein
MLRILQFLSAALRCPEIRQISKTGRRPLPSNTPCLPRRNFLRNSSPITFILAHHRHDNICPWEKNQTIIFAGFGIFHIFVEFYFLQPLD